MNIVEFVKHLYSLDIKLWIEDERLRCRVPKAAATAELRTQLAARKDELLDFLREAQASSADMLAPIRPRPRVDGLPLSFAQQRLWFLAQLDPAGAAYNIPTALRLRGTLDVAALARGLNEIVVRHEALRTTFTTLAGQAVQKIEATAELYLQRHDLRSLALEAREAEVRERVQSDAGMPFDLTRAPLVRARLFHMARDEYVLLLNLHHIAADGWSMGVFVRELAALYRAYTLGEDSPLQPLPIQYSDFAAWQRDYLSGETLEEQLTYWKSSLSGAPDMLALPTDYVRPALQTYRGARYEFALPVALIEKLKVLSQQEGATLFMALLAGFKVLLCRYSGQSDISVGTPIANRNRAEIEGLIGFFVNTLVLRSDLTGNPTFREALRREREVTLGAYAHQDLPFEKLVEVLHPQRDLSRSPLFQVLFSLQNAPIGELVFPNLSLSPMEMEGTTAKFDLSLSLAENAAGVSASMAYNVDLLKRETVVRMMRHWQILLAAFAEDADRCIHDPDLLSTAERQRILVEWNAASQAFPVEEPFVCLFERQVQLTPAQVAATAGESALTYAELAARAARVCGTLRALGVGPEVRVGLYMEPGLDLLAGFLGILKAGGVVLPLDPSAPLARNAFMMQDATVLVLLTQSPLASTLPGGDAHVLCVDDLEETPAAVAAESSAGTVSLDNAAYVIYTSGSTGKPKGVVCTQRGLVNYLRWVNATFDVRLPAITKVTFDAALKQLLAPLLAGRAVWFVPPDSVAQPTELLRGLCAQAGSGLNCVPSLWKVLLDAAERADGELRRENLTHLLLGGEALSMELVQRTRVLFPHMRIWNLYGPTEATVNATADDLSEAREVSIGRPIAGASAYILDDRLRVLPAGMPGELYIGGPGVAREYLKRPALSAERFLTDPFSDTSGARMYRSGDLARFRADGRIEFLGRLDDQVKIRGFRIELGEIASLLRKHPDVRDVVVLARVQGTEKRLVAYVVGGESEPTARALRDFLREQLPDYMLPAAFVFLAELPLLLNGKVDRRALPEPEARADVEVHYVAPRTPTEELLAGIWGQVLGLERVGVEDNFFELGGHSLLATQVTSRMREALGVEVPLRDLFAQPTVASLADALRAQHFHGQDVAAPPLLPRSPDAPLALSFAQQRLWFLDQLEPDSAAYNIPSAVQLKGDLDVVALTDALNCVVARHEVLRTTFVDRDGEALQVIAPSLRIAVPLLDLRDLAPAEQEAEVQRLSVADAQRLFDLRHGPLLGVSLLWLRDDVHILLLNMHHIISDAWSKSIFIRELAEYYRAAKLAQAPSLPDLALQYADFAVWQRDWLRGAVLEEQLAYWKAQLERGSPALEMPLDHARPPVQTFAGAKCARALSTELVFDLKALGRQENTTLFMTLLAAFKVLLYRYSGQTDISVGSPIANRTRRELEGVIGFFVNTLVLRSDLSGDPSFRELLARVREVALGAYAHQDLPFEMLVETIQPQRDMSRHPLFQVMFVLQNAPVTGFELPGLTLRPLAVQTETSKFDLLLFTQEIPDGVALLAEYNTDLFDAGTIERLLANFEALLCGIVAEPGTRIAALPLLGEEELALRGSWESPVPVSRPELPLQTLFEAQAARTPEALAVDYPERGESLTYAALERRANQLARYLRAAGVGPDVPVAISVTRSLDMVVGVLGVLKAGGAYLPLDPAYPPARRAFMLEDAQAPVLLTQAELREQLPPYAGRVVCLDTDWERIAQQSDGKLVCEVDAENLVYVIYTSGSTGRPKGVAMRHAPLVNLMAWQERCTTLNRAERTAQFASLSFDVSCQEMFSTWSLGGTLVLLSEEIRRDALALLDFLAREKVERLYLPFVALQHLAEAAATAGAVLPTSLRQLVTAGEQLRITPHIAELMTRLEGCRLHNQYGPSESHVITAHTLAEDVDTWPLLPPIGRAVANAATYVLDARLQPLPLGVVGELYLGGPVLARDYLNRPALTAERYLLDPFAERAGARMYKTGDRARYLPNGNLEFLGRADHQVKVRGYRIELGEVEAAVNAHAAVQEAVAMGRGAADDTAGRQLVAYVVPEPDAGLDIADLRQFLQERLPEYMIPGRFVRLERLPLTPSGKVDRRALPAPEEVVSEDAVAVVASRDVVELQLARIWEAVLGVHPVGVTQNFFELGGHSLLAVRVISRIQRVFDYQLPLAALFQNPSVESLAVLLRRRDEAVPRGSSLVLMRAGQSARKPLFLVHAAGGSVFCYSALLQHLDAARPCYGLQVPDLDGDSSPVDLSQVAALARHYVTLLREVQPQGPYNLVGWSMGGVLAYEMARQLHPQEVRLVLCDAFAPSNPRRGAEDEMALLASFARDLGLPAEMLDWNAKEFRMAAPEERLRWVLDGAQRAHLISPDVDVAYMQQRYRVFKRNAVAMLNYRPQPYTGSLLLLQAEKHSAKVARQFGWGSLVKGDLETQVLPGNHYTLLREPQVALLAEHLERYLHEREGIE